MPKEAAIKIDKMTQISVFVCDYPHFGITISNQLVNCYEKLSTQKKEEKNSIYFQGNPVNLKATSEFKCDN